MRDKVSGARRWVVKIGSALLTADGRGLDQAAMAVWVDQMVALRQAVAELRATSRVTQATLSTEVGAMENWIFRPRERLAPMAGGLAPTAGAAHVHLPRDPI